MKQRLIHTLLLLFTVLVAQAQYAPSTSQYMFSMLTINPAYTGSREALCITALHRDQWTGLEGAPQTQTLAIHSPLKKNRIALGLLLYRDVIGVSDKKGVLFSYAYRIPVAKGKLSFGISGGVDSERSAWTSITTVQGGDEAFSHDSPVYIAPDAGAGLFYYSDKLYAGISVPTLLSHSVMPSGKMHTYHDASNYNVLFASGVLIPLNQAIFKPSLLVKYHAGAPVQVDINSSFFLYGHLELGASYRTGDAVVGLIGYNITKQLRVGYSYDRSLSILKNYNKGSHEFMLQYEFGYKSDAMNPRYF
jgi:type IX secretion system PorP/SprF family membrane protein